MGCVIVSYKSLQSRGKHSFWVRYTTEVHDAGVKIEKRSRHDIGLFRARGQRLLVWAFGQTELRRFPVQPMVYGRRVYVSTTYITSMDSGKRGIVRLSSHTGPCLTFHPVAPPQFVITISWFINCRFPASTSCSFSSLKNKYYSFFLTSLMFFKRQEEREQSFLLMFWSEIRRKRKRKWKFWSFRLCAENSKTKYFPIK